MLFCLNVVLAVFSYCYKSKGHTVERTVRKCLNGLCLVNVHKLLSKLVVNTGRGCNKTTALSPYVQIERLLNACALFIPEGQNSRPQSVRHISISIYRSLSSTIKRSHIPLEANFLKQGFAIFFQADITRDEMSVPHLVFAANDLLH